MDFIALGILGVLDVLVVGVLVVGVLEVGVLVVGVFLLEPNPKLLKNPVELDLKSLKNAGTMSVLFTKNLSIFV